MSAGLRSFLEALGENLFSCFSSARQATLRSLHFVPVQWDITVVVSVGDKCNPFCIFKNSLWMLCDQGIGGIQRGSRETGQEMSGEENGDRIEEKKRYEWSFKTRLLNSNFWAVLGTHLIWY